MLPPTVFVQYIYIAGKRDILDNGFQVASAADTVDNCTRNYFEIFQILPCEKHALET
jgi:hypothetical protein